MYTCCSSRHSIKMVAPLRYILSPVLSWESFPRGMQKAFVSFPSRDEGLILRGTTLLAVAGRSAHRASWPNAAPDNGGEAVPAYPLQGGSAESSGGDIHRRRPLPRTNRQLSEGADPPVTCPRHRFWIIIDSILHLRRDCQDLYSIFSGRKHLTP